MNQGSRPQCLKSSTTFDAFPVILDEKSRSGSRFQALLILMILLLSPLTVFAQTQNWVWIGGSNAAPGSTSGSPTVYGSLGVSAAANFPGGRGGASSWTDSSGNLWLFAGQGYDASGSLVYLNDLWEYAPATGEWTWRSGSSTVSNLGGQSGIYGTLGIDTAGNLPGSRTGALSWIDSNDHLWLFGGYGFDSAGTRGYLNDLWQFNPNTVKWIWMGGATTITASDSGQAGVYGSLGIPSSTNIPGSRSASVSWTDKQGNFWLFGGNGFDSTGTRGDLNDLWEFNTTTHQWVWVNGSTTVGPNGGAPGVYNTMGVPSPTEVPSGRAGASSWTDSNGDFWLFGGAGVGSVGLNDLWEFNSYTGQWAWMSGSATPGQTGVFGTLGVAAPANVPPGRVCANAWIDISGNLWLFSGAGSDSTGTSGFFDDIWSFNLSTNQWTWMAGSSLVNQPSVYGALGVPAATNEPGGRYTGTSWTDNNGRLWFFGGYARSLSSNNSYLMNDFWEAGSIAPPPTFSPAPGTFAQSQSVTISDSLAGATIYFTTDGTTPTSTSSVYSGAISISSTKTLQAIAVAPSYLQSVAASATYTLNLPSAATPVFTPVSGSYTSPQTITISDATPGSTIYYTTEITPTTSSPIYTGPFTLSSTVTIHAMAVASGYASSTVANGAYTFPAATATPTFSVAAGSYSVAQTVTIGDATAGAAIFYTTDGSTPTQASAAYTGPLSVATTETLKAIALASGYSTSTVASAPYTIAAAAATPTFSVAAGSYTALQTVTISDTTNTATITYTTDGSTPTTASTIYTGPITVASSETLKAVAFKSGYSPSAVASAAYIITLTPAATPAFTPVPGSYTAPQTITITDATPGATIYYTTNGTTPTANSVLYTAPFTISSSITLNAIASASGFGNSAVASASYTLPSTPVVTVTLSSTSITTTQMLSLVVLVAGTGSNAAPSGTVTVTGGGYTSPAKTLMSGSTTMAIPAGSLSTGHDGLIISYTPDASSAPQYNVATATVSVTVGKANPSISWPVPAAITYGTALSAAQLNAGSAIAGTFAYTPAAGTVLTAGTQALSVTMTPTDTTDYDSATATVSLVVTQAVPTLAWGTPVAITSGTVLSATQLDATASVPGSLVYSEPVGTIMPVGSDTLGVTFTPTDAIDYQTATANVTLTVNPLPNPVPIVSSMSPAFASAGGAAFALTVNGTGFVANSIVYWGTTALPTQYVSATQLTAVVPSTLIVTAGTSAVTVQSQTSGGSASNSFQFEVDSGAAGSTNAPTFTSTAVSVASGSTAAYPVTLPSAATVVSVTCLNLPVGASCSYSSTTNVVTIATSSTTPAGNYQITVIFSETLPGTSAAFLFLPFILIPLALIRRRMISRGIWLTATLCLLMVALTASCVGCSVGTLISQGDSSADRPITTSSVVGLTIK